LKVTIPCERHQMVETDNFICLIERAAKAMKNAAHLTGVSAEDFQCVFPRVALMNHGRSARAPPPARAAVGTNSLFRFARTIANLRFDFFVGLTSQCCHNLHLLFLGDFFTRQTVVIPGRSRQSPQRASFSPARATA
jgi:hypothetical protein